MITTRLTEGPKHHLFGFHDLAITSRASGRFLGLAVERIDRPPLGEDLAEVIVWDDAGPDGHFAPPRVLATTRNYNFPQGARQQWLGGDDTVIVNEVDAAGAPVSGLYDAGGGGRIGQLSASVYCIDRAGARAYSVDFGRLHRLGGYGHSNVADRAPETAQPHDNGIFVSDIAADRTDLLLSIAEMAGLAGLDPEGLAHVFFTHLVLDPTGTRLAFLLRYRLADGGEETCLCTVATDGTGARVIARGFLSHFDWIAPDRIMIWGRRSGAVAAARRHPLLANPVARALLPLVKGPLRALMGKSGAMAMSYLSVTDSDQPEVTPFAVGVLTADGHPMANPVYRDWLLTDTYPDAEGVRDLMLYEIASAQRHDLGRFRKLDTLPSAETVAETAAHLARAVDVAFPADLYAFTRSGLHCDLHPRWSADGRLAVFDSIHEGSRQIYAIDVGEMVAGPAVPGT
ncbi:MAG: hypothetical protein VX874_00235 [Pseudomonadota bacterium]|nr:hypothetical protein [Pseudomonadota bacterium]